MATIVVARRFNGPAASGNGGYTAGALVEASGLPGPVTVQLRRPPPLDTPLDVVPTEGGVELRVDGEPGGTEVVAAAVPAGPAAWTEFDPVPLPTARSLEPTYAGFRGAPFPRCFSCGPERRDGLRIFPGRLDADRVAASWTPDDTVVQPDGTVGAPVAWAALDCVSAWSSDLIERPMVLGQMVARVESPPRVGTPYVMVGRFLRTEGRKTWTASAMLDPDGLLVGQAEHLWIEVRPEVAARLQG